MLNVHLVPHTHDDVGWLKTVDELYYGANNSIQHAGVQYILDTVIDSLTKNPNRKFIYAEQAFFQRWWNEQSAETQDTVKDLVAKGQFQFIDGGWTQHDEACPYYVTMIDQTTLGHFYLNEQFSYLPTVGWQIDPFGHSATQPSLLSAKVGFSALYFARIDYQDRDQRIMEKAMEFVWSASPSLGPQAAIFSGAFVGGSYGPPPNLCFDVSCNNDNPVMDDQCLEDDNVQALVDSFVASAYQYGNYTLGNNVLFLMGSDFNYENADMYFKNMDKLIHYVNQDGRVNAFYSNPMIYTQAKYAENLTWPLKTDDFFPICQDWTEESGRRGHAYWSGFFTSRPLLKYYERTMSSYLQTAGQLQLLARLPLDQVTRPIKEGLLNADPTSHPKPSRRAWPFWMHYDVTNDLLPLRIGVAELTHHDGITGTSKQHVAYDYARRLTVGRDIADEVVNQALHVLLNTSAEEYYQLCHLVNESICAVTTFSASFQIVVYNPLPFTRSEIISVPVSSADIQVFDRFMNELPMSFTPTAPLPNQTLDASLWLHFPVVLNPLEATVFVVRSFGEPLAQDQSPPSPIDMRTIVSINEKNDFRRNIADPALKVRHYDELEAVSILEKSYQDHPWRTEEVQARRTSPDGVFSIENQHLVVYFNSGDGRMLSMTNKDENITLPIDQGYYWYEGSDIPGAGAGAYMFRPNHTNFDASNISCVGDCTATYQIVNTSLVIEVRQAFSPWLLQTIRLWNDSLDLELEFTVGPIDISDSKGKEIVSRFTTPIKSQEMWYTDANGREMIPRRRNYRATFQLNLTEPQAANYYPVGSAITMLDEDYQLAVIPDRSQGGTSLRDGQLELLVHRRLLVDDGEGVGEPLNETLSITPYPNPVRLGPGITVRGRHFLAFHTPANASRHYRFVQDKLFSAPLLAFNNNIPPMSPHPLEPSQGVGPANFTGLLPENVGLVSFHQWNESCVLIRVGHRFGVGEDEVLSQPVNVSLAPIFEQADLQVASIVEMSLSANQLKSSVNRLQFRYVNETMQHEMARERTPALFEEDRSMLQGDPFTYLLTPLQIRTFLAFVA